MPQENLSAFAIAANQGDLVLPLIERSSTAVAVNQADALADPTAPLRMSGYLETAARAVPANPPPRVETLEEMKRWQRIVAARQLPVVATPLPVLTGQLPKRVDHRQFQTNLRTSQGSRGTCWAFAGIAALEAAYARQGVHVKLSEHYLFHISKSHENQVQAGAISSLVGFQGSTNIVHHLAYWNVPAYDLAPYMDQGPLKTLADSIPGTGKLLVDDQTKGTKAQVDWLEYDLRHIPLQARWNCLHGVESFGILQNYTDKDLKTVLAAGHDVVFSLPGHVILIYGYDDNQGVWLVKNSQSINCFQTIAYSSITQRFDAYYVKKARTPRNQWAPMWVGRWECDHDGWLGRLIIRRYLYIEDNKGVPPPTAPIALGEWFGEDGSVRPVVGGFVDGGRGLVCTIGGQRFELYLHGRDFYHAAGRCEYGGKWYGVTLSRGANRGAGAAFDRSETIGLWDSCHDGWRGQIRIGVEPGYVKAEDGAVCGARIDGGAIVQQVDFHANFGPTNPDQYFQLLHNTREDGVIGGITRWGGRDWPAEARMSPNLYLARSDGELLWYRHLGRYTRTGTWDATKKVGTGWNSFASIFGGVDGVIYAITTAGKLLWYYHDGRNQGTMNWQGPKDVGTGWTMFTRVFAGPGGVIYGVEPNGTLRWYRHLGRRDGSFRWQGPLAVGSQWQGFKAVAAGPDGIIYAIQPDGRLLWYRHYGHDQGYGIWAGAIQVGTGWAGYDRLFVAGNGFIYATNKAGELWMWRHHGYLVGSTEWSAGVKVGTGWAGSGVRAVIMS